MHPKVLLSLDSLAINSAIKSLAHLQRLCLVILIPNSFSLSALKHVRPGNGFDLPFVLTEKVEVNGSNQNPIWKHLKSSAPIPDDDLMTKAQYLVWTPISRSDIGK
jgi:hypothetical protein